MHILAPQRRSHTAFQPVGPRKEKNPRKKETSSKDIGEYPGQNPDNFLVGSAALVSAGVAFPVLCAAGFLSKNQGGLPVKRFVLFVSVTLLAASSAVMVRAQSQPVASSAIEFGVPRLVKFSGVLRDGRRQALSATVQVVASLYASQSGGTPLWAETQTVHPDASGRYGMSLGITQPAGLPLDLFASGEARWLGVQIIGEPEQPRVLLMSVPYALKAADAETIGGLPPSAFMLAAAPAAGASSSSSAAQAPISPPSPGVVNAGAEPAVSGGGTTSFVPLWLDSSGTLGNSVMFQSGSGSTARIGIGTTTPSATLDVRGTETVRGALTMAATHAATSTGGGNSQPMNLTASAFNSGTSAAVNQSFRWQAEPVGNNTSSPGGSLNLLSSSGSAAPTETGFSFARNGRITFAPGQIFPGTIAGVTAGTDLTGGGTSGIVTLNLDTTKTDLRYAQLAAPNTFTANQTVNATVNVTNGIVATAPGNADIAIQGTAFTGVQGTSNSTGAGVSGTGLGLGVSGTSTSTTATTGFGVLGIANSPGGYGVYGESVGTSGGVGVQGTTFTTDGIGLAGAAANTTAGGTAIQATVRSPNGTALKAQTFSTTGSPIGVFSDTSLTSTGIPFAAKGPAGQVFSVAGSGLIKNNTDTTAHNAVSFIKGSFTTPSTFAAIQAANGSSLGEVAWLSQFSSANLNAVLKLVLPTGSTSNFLECNIPDGTRKCHISVAGSFVGGSDFAEALPASGPHSQYEPGDVMVMSADGKAVGRTTSRYSRRVVGVYSTRPAVLGAEKGAGVTRVDADDIPVAITGIVPTKVSTENGAVRVGDLLVTSSKPGYAMKATDRGQMLGAVVGKALETLPAGSGTIRVLVILK